MVDITNVDETLILLNNNVMSSVDNFYHAHLVENIGLGFLSRLLLANPKLLN